MYIDSTKNSVLTVDLFNLKRNITPEIQFGVDEADTQKDLIVMMEIVVNRTVSS